MIDEDESTNIDICFSYDYDDYITTVNSYKDNWSPKIFFSQIFADLKLSDFSTESVDYDNYDPNVEFDEHNYRFKMESEAIQHNNSGINVASPYLTAESASKDYYYGNINGGDIYTKVANQFDYAYENREYKYMMQEDNEPMKYAGATIAEGPYESATFKGETSFATYEDENKTKYIINGVSFDNALMLDETTAQLSLQIFSKGGDTTDRTGFPADTFSVVVALTDDGTLAEEDDASSEEDNNTIETIVTSAGVACPIKDELKFGTSNGQYTTIRIDLVEYI